MLNLDTHILLHAVAGQITARERKLLEGDQWSISCVVIWEIAKLAQLGRIEIDLDDADLTRLLVHAFTPGPSRWIFAAGFARWISAPIPPTKSSPPPASFIVCPCSRQCADQTIGRRSARALALCRYDVGGFWGQSFASRSFSILSRSKSSPRFIPGHRFAADSQALRLARFPVQNGHVLHCNGRTG